VTENPFQQDPSDTYSCENMLDMIDPREVDKTVHD